jgi:hypothetical protein
VSCVSRSECGRILTQTHMKTRSRKSDGTRGLFFRERKHAVHPSGLLPFSVTVGSFDAAALALSGIQEFAVLASSSFDDKSGITAEGY